MSIGDKSPDAARLTQVKRKAAQGAVWTIMQNVGSRVMGLAFFVVLARLLSPEDFGLMASAAIFLVVSDLLTEQGLGQALIQRSAIQPQHLDTAFWVQVATACGVCIIGQVFAPNIAALFQRSDLVPVLRVLLLSTPITALGAVHLALLSRELRFKEIAVRNWTATGIAGAVAVAGAMSGWQTWSLVAQSLTASVSGTVFLWTARPWRPGRAVSRSHFRELFGFSVHLFLQRGLQTINQRTDQLLIGHVLGPVALGVYVVGFRVIDSVASLFVNPFTQLSLPVFSRLQDSDDALRSAYDKALRAATLAGLPASVILFLLAPDIVAVVLGAKWSEAVPIVRILAALVTLRALFAANSAVFLAKGLSRLRLQISLAHTALNVVLFVAFVRDGLVAVCLAAIASNVLILPVHTWLVGRLIKYPPKAHFAATAPGLIGASSIVVVILLIQQTWAEPTPTAVRLVLATVAALAIYVVCALAISSETRRLCLKLREAWGKTV